MREHSGGLFLGEIGPKHGTATATPWENLEKFRNCSVQPVAVLIDNGKALAVRACGRAGALGSVAVRKRSGRNGEV